MAGTKAEGVLGKYCHFNGNIASLLKALETIECFKMMSWSKGFSLEIERPFLVNYLGEFYTLPALFQPLHKASLEKENKLVFVNKSSCNRIMKPFSKSVLNEFFFSEQIWWEEIGGKENLIKSAKMPIF